MRPRMKTMFSRIAALMVLGLMVPAAMAQPPQSLLDETDTLLEDATTARDLPVRKPGDDQATHHGVGRFRGLNKLTTQKEDVTAAIGGIGHFGTLEITLLDCWQSGPDEPFEAKALVELWENKPQFTQRAVQAKGSTAPVVARRKLFEGWLVAGHPSLSGLEHPVYSLSLLGCGN